MASDDGLAKVSYLPGVIPPPAEPPRPSSDSAALEPPTMRSVFGARNNGSEFSGTEDDSVEDEPTESLEAQQQRAEKVSMQALTRRGQSRWELQKALLGRDIAGELVEAELDRLEGVGLIDDAALAETLVRTQHERKGLGRSALMAELRRRHIDQQHIEDALEQIDDDEEQSRATELAVRRAPQLRSLDGETAKRRLSGFLMRKGYSGSVVRTAVDAALNTRDRPSSGVRFR